MTQGLGKSRKKGQANVELKPWEKTLGQQVGSHHRDKKVQRMGEQRAES